MAKKIALNINLKLYKKGELVYNATKRLKTKLYAEVRCSDCQNGKWDEGRCAIYYDTKRTYWNKFTFTSVPEFREKFNPCCEPKLLAFLNGDLDF